MRAKTQIIKESLDLESQAKIDRVKYNPKKYKLDNLYYETKRELVTRLRYQLFKRKKDWNINQENRWKIIQNISDFDEIISSYEIISDLFAIFDQDEKALSFQKWFTKISKIENITEMQNSGRMIQNHLVRIMAYFDN